MSAELLREAASAIRDEWSDGHEPMGTAWHRERDFHRAVADMLDHTAEVMEQYALARQVDKGVQNLPAIRVKKAAAVARAYLGRDA